MLSITIKKILTPLFLCIGITMVSCKNDTGRSIEKKHVIDKEQLTTVNKQLIQTENQSIEAYINRYGWKMKTSPTGLRYMIYLPGDGKKVEPGATVVIRATLNLLSGDTLFSWKTEGERTIVLGRREVESGLEEGILLMHVGDKAKFIIPSHLAFGLPGDHGRIPPKAVLVYDTELIEWN